MYSEMLAEDMVPDAEQRRSYLQTLKDESDRLAALVENVLAYARLEEGRLTAHRERLSVAALIERLRNFGRGVGIVEPIRVRVAA